MSNIEKIRQEIERRISQAMQGRDTITGPLHINAEGLLSFIDSLPNEEPSKELEEAAEEFAVSYDQGTCDGIAQDCFIAGAEWQREQLLKGSPLPEDTVLFHKGVEEGKRLMMEDAVEGEIGYWNQRGLSIRLDKSLETLGYDMDTKVRIIIIKDND